MKRVTKLTERDLSRIVRRVVKEDEESKKELDVETKLDDIFLETTAQTFLHQLVNLVTFHKKKD